MSRIRKRLTYRTKTILSTIGVVLASLLISGVYFSITYYTTLREGAYSRLEGSVDNVAHTLDQTLFSINNASFLFTATPSVRGWINGDISLSGNTSVSFSNLANMRSDIEYSLMFNDAWLSKYIDQVYIVIDDEFIPIVSRKARSLPVSDALNKRVYESTGEIQAMSYFYLLEGESPTVFMVRRVNNIRHDKQLTFIYNINMDSFAQALTGLDKDINVNVIYQGGIIWSSDQRMLGRQPEGMEELSEGELLRGRNITVDKKTHIMAYRFLKQKDFTVQILTPSSVITDQVLPSIMSYLPVMAILIILFTIAAGLTAGAYTRFMRHLTEGLEKVRQENYDATLPAYRDPDLNGISSAFNSMTAAIKTLIATVYQSELSLKEAEIKLLQSQMNPHFLMNTLTTISTTALLEEKQNIYKMVTSLSNMMEVSLYNSAENSLFLSVDKELEYIECYLYLQRIRFREKLKYCITLENEDLRKLYIPRLSIEPIVENAVIHGIESLVDGGTIDVRIFLDGNDLIITVTDNGVGFDVEQVLGSEPEPEQKSHHIGIHNTDKRIRLLFGDKYGISFESERNVRTRASIKLPVLAALEGENINAESNNR